MKNINEELKKIFESKILLKVIYIAGILLLACLVFRAGMYAGYRRAGFGRDWGENYLENFGGHRFGKVGQFGGMYGMMGTGSFPNPNGAVGKIIKIELPEIIVADKDGTEKIIVIDKNTIIRDRMEEAKDTDIKVDEYAVAIGTPNSKGQITAKFIRIMPALPAFSADQK